MKTLTLIAASLILFGCSSDNSDQAVEPRQETVGAEVADNYTQQMNKARDVELQLEQQKRDMDAAIEGADPGH